MKNFNFISMIAVTMIVIGCANDSIDDGGQVACTEEARSSVTLDVVDENSDPLTDATVTFTIDGGSTEEAECFDSSTNGCSDYVLAYEQAGVFNIAVSKDGYITAEESITVGMTDDGCHVDGQVVTITLIQN